MTDKPNAYRIRVNACRVHSPATQRAIACGLTFDVTRRAENGSGAAKTVDPHEIVVRPGDSVEFELGDTPAEARKPQLRVSWKFNGGKRWGGAPAGPGQRVRIPGDAGFAGGRFSFCAEIDLGKNLRLPSQLRGRNGNTVAKLDPDIIVDEC